MWLALLFARFLGTCPRIPYSTALVKRGFQTGGRDQQRGLEPCLEGSRVDIFVHSCITFANSSF